ncbi:SIR2 family protein [Pseudenhygromyxa sp. WMMC2535]|uniref:SIR2 family protein n=1 Tax=Pseudenhygromyxa sp. WMMC2535 TaxID=2712867 RepID=UPI0015554012|nr:SIR2 family protein [Pseudenhygromyxa sp. WMMC2535]NVB43010.1 SIR2 family protein [Pseudenhygromyxa sp. WMMC2535]
MPHARPNIDLEQLRAHRRPLVVYAGAQLSLDAGLPSRRELAHALIDALPEQTSERRRETLREQATRAELADVFTELEREMTAARFGSEVERALAHDHLQPPPLTRVLASLGSRVAGVVTPNLDRLIERAFASRLVTYTRPSMDLLHREDWLLKLHGSLPERRTWALTRDQLARVSVRDPVYREVLRALFIGQPMLFIGTPEDDPIFDDVVDCVRGLAQGSPPRHWALLPRAALTGPFRAKLDEAGIAAIAHDTPEELLEQLASLAADPGALPSLPPPRRERRPSSGALRILFVSASPRDMDGLAVDRELRTITAAIERSPGRARIELVPRVAACFGDLSRALLERPFDLVHIASHGEAVGVILDEGRQVSVPAQVLASLFDEYASPEGSLRCVVLNACWSQAASQPIAKVPAVVAMDGPVDDHAALAFSEGFYDALGAGHEFAKAFREGKRRAECAVPGGAFAPQLTLHQCAN